MFLGWYEFFTSRLYRYEQFYSNWVSGKFTGKVYILRYDDLSKKFAEAVKSVVKMLADKEVDQNVLSCMIRNREGDFHRPAPNFTREDIFTRRDEARMQEVKERVDKKIKACMDEGLCVDIISGHV